MPYGQKALDMYSVVEGAIVNGEMPARYALDLLSKAQFDEEARINSYREYTGSVSQRSRGSAGQSSRRAANDNTNATAENSTSTNQAQNGGASSSQAEESKNEINGQKQLPNLKDANNRTNMYILEDVEVKSEEEMNDVVKR